MKRIKSRFTLIEMLAVAAIASILIALMTPAVQAMLFGSRVDNYISNFKLGMERAQSEAVAARKYVAMILPTKHKVNDKPELKPYCKGGYRLAYVKKDGSSYKWDSWVEEWKNPNDGAMLVSVAETAPTAAPAVPGEAIFGTLLEKVDSLPSADIGSACESNPALIFSPYGGVMNRDKELYFTFTEAKFNDGDDSYELPNSDNFLVLKLNPVTGRISYFDPYKAAAE